MPLIDRIDLTQNWQMYACAEGQGDQLLLHKSPHARHKSYACSVPADIHDVLFAAGEIPDPFMGINAERFGKKDAWSSFDYHQDPEHFVEDFHHIQNQEYWFCCRLELDQTQICDSVELLCKGLATEADIWLNGQCLDRVANAHIEHRFQCVPFLQCGENYIAIRLMCGVRLKSESWRQHEIRALKYSFGWDWAPRLMNCGITRGVSLEFSDNIKINSLYCEQHLSEDLQQVDLHLRSECEALSALGRYVARWSVVDSNGVLVTSSE
ncbi:MAG: hypothetical protein HRU15_12050, partial [Planctomycetes bacterium]|nr:hypothetical protein [Planctomycetota bacterium]